MLKCLFCGKEIKVGHPCYSVDFGGDVYFRHTYCNEMVTEKPVRHDVEPRFGEVADNTGELD